MQKVSVKLNSSQDVQKFVETLSCLDGDFELLSGKYILDARSLMGIFSLDLTQPLELKVYQDTAENLDAIKPYLA